MPTFMQQAEEFFHGFLSNHSSVTYRLGLIFFLILGLCSCSSLTPSSLTAANITPIREIKPLQDNQKKLYIQGHVEKRVPLLKQWVYQIDDSTGKIWVLTDRGDLQVGQQVVFRGKVHYQSIPIAGQELGDAYLEEN
jgi:hypothetical protein